MMYAGSLPQSLLFDINTVYHHVYYAEGIYEVSVNISNHLSWAVLTAQMIVATPVVNMMWVMPIAHASINVPFVAGIIMEMGTNVTLIWDFGDFSASAVVNKLRIGIFILINCILVLYRQFYIILYTFQCTAYSICVPRMTT